MPMESCLQVRLVLNAPYPLYAPRSFSSHCSHFIILYTHFYLLERHTTPNVLATAITSINPLCVYRLIQLSEFVYRPSNLIFHPKWTTVRAIYRSHLLHTTFIQKTFHAGGSQRYNDLLNIIMAVRVLYIESRVLPEEYRTEFKRTPDKRESLVSQSILLSQDIKPNHHKRSKILHLR